MKDELELDTLKQQIILLKNIITADENERLEISYSLNESIAQMLAAVQLHIKMAKKKISADGISFIEEAETILREAILELKTLASSISPFTLKNIGFVNLLQDLVLLIEDHHEIKCDINIEKDSISSISINNQNILYQIIQLQTINILKCKIVEKVSITVKHQAGKIYMQIKDDGIRPSSLAEEEIEAFINLKERVKVFDGAFMENFENGYSLEVFL
jgi:two-component system, NarL family, sensor histidine kinase UhpB